MKKVSFSERHGVRKYILHDCTPEPINVVEISDDGWEIKTDEGEIFNPPFYSEKGEINAYQLEGKWYKIKEEIGIDDEHMGPWDEDPYLYDLGKVVTLEGTEDEQQYIFDGWCNLYPRPNEERGQLARDLHPHVALFFT